MDIDENSQSLGSLSSAVDSLQCLSTNSVPFGIRDVGTAIVDNIDNDCSKCVRDVEFCFVLHVLQKETVLLGPFKILYEQQCSVKSECVIEDKGKSVFAVDSCIVFRIICFEYYHHRSLLVCNEVKGGLCTPLMASLKQKAKECGTGKDDKDVCLSDSVLELSVTVGYLDSDVKREEMSCLDILLREHCVAGVVALERGETEDHLHFQMVVRARCRNARSFGILVRKYMGWYGRRGMTPVGKVTCKVLTNRYIHTFIGMIGYCLKDAGAEHFDHCMFNISDDDVIAGKTLHTIYGRADCKRRVTLTNKNITNRMFVWYKYRSTRKLTATFFTTLTNMIKSGIFIPAASWIIPLNGQGMDHRRMTSLWKCITDPENVCKIDIQEIFVQKRNFVKGRYFTNDNSEAPPSTDDDLPYSPASVAIKGSEAEKKPSSPLLKSAMRRCRRLAKVSRVLFEEDTDIEPEKKSVCFNDDLGEYIGLKDNAKLIDSEFRSTTNALYGNGRKVDSNDSEHNGTKGGLVGVVDAHKTVEVIEISSDSEEEAIHCNSGSKVLYDRMMAFQKVPRYNIESFIIKKEPRSPSSRCSG